MISSRDFTPMTLKGMNRNARAYSRAGNSSTSGSHQGTQSGRTNGMVMPAV